MFNPLFTKITVDEKETEVTALGWPCLTRSNAVLERCCWRIL